MPSSRLRLSLAVVAAVVASLLVPVLPVVGPAAAAPRPVTPTTTEVALGAVEVAGGREVRTSAAKALERVSVVGATWPSGRADGLVVEVRTRTGGAWQPWRTLEVEDDHGPDEDSAEGRSALRGGTEPFVAVGEDVQVRASGPAGRLPRGLEVSLVDPGSGPADAAVGVRQSGSASAAATRPTIHSRAAWGADESLREGTPSYGQVQVGFIHHTVSSNTYAAADVPAMIRGIYAFHVVSRGWNDLGYNMLVDRFGRVWEGRYGGVDKAVVGAQAGGYNSGSMGVSVIGDFTSTNPPSAVTSALTSVLAWRFAGHGIPATGTVDVNGTVFNRISGHRDASQTSCPGARLYALVPSIRSAVAARIGTLPRTGVMRDLDRNGAPDLVSLETVASGDKVARLHLTADRTPLRGASAIGGGWNTVRHTAASPDLTGDGLPDVVAAHLSTGALRVYPGTGTGGLRSPISSGAGWDRMAAVIPAGDQDGDGRADLLGVGGTGLLAVYAGRGNGTFAAGRVVGSGYQGYVSLTAASDRTGDGIPDVAGVRSSDGALVTFAARGDGSLEAPVRVGGGWNVLSPVTTAGDLDGDGFPDLLGRESGGAMRSYYGDATGAPVRWNRWGRGWQSMAQLSSGVDLDGDDVVDVLGVLTTSNNGTLRLYRGTGERDELRTVDVPLPRSATAVGIGGDIDGDGNADLVARAGDGIIALRGLGGAVFAGPVTVAASGWGAMPVVVPGADVSYDGIPDLLATSSTGLVLRYSFTRDFTLERPLVLDQSWGSLRSYTAAGAMNVDANGDVVTLTGDGALQLFRGGGDTPLLASTTLRAGQADIGTLLGVGDWNGDGDLDLVARGTDGRLWLYAGRGDGRLWGGRQPLAVSRTSTLG